jgi:hypothetical protein
LGVAAAVVAAYLVSDTFEVVLAEMGIRVRGVFFVEILDYKVVVQVFDMVGRSFWEFDLVVVTLVLTVIVVCVRRIWSC